MKKTIICSLIILIAVCFSCKKGEDDPAFTLSTRKARLAGEWTLESGNLTISYKKPGKTYGEANYSFTKDSYNIVNTATGGTNEGKYVLKLTFTKDGNYTFTQLQGSSNVLSDGTWDFMAGIGEYNNKERLSFNAASISGGSYWLDGFNKSSNYFIYNIRELRSKKLVLETVNELTEVSGVDSVSCYLTSKYTFVQ